MSHLVYARGISLVSNGIFAGFGVGINLVSVPALKSTSDPLPSFSITYKNGSKIAVTNILLATGSHFYIYYKTRNIRSLWCGVLTFFIIPYTLFIMKPINDQLFALQTVNSKDNNKVQDLISKWDRRQWIRTIVSNAAFLMNVFYY
ncbi:unnamed protein product [Cunninghamella blakesleeana]